MSHLARARIHSVLGTLVIGLFLFISAGDPIWWPAWAYIIILVSSTILIFVGPLRLDEGLIEERISRKPDAKSWDRYFVGLVDIFTIAELIIPGLDHRFYWTSSKPIWEHLLGLAFVIIGTFGLMWAMKINRFFSAIIRIQNDRGHQVVDAGPYRVVRHPGYAFWGVRTFGVPLLFGSNPAFIVAVLFVSMFIIRTILEDQVLQNELAGYREYTERIRWKLIKGVW